MNFKTGHPSNKIPLVAFDFHKALIGGFHLYKMQQWVMKKLGIIFWPFLSTEAKGSHEEFAKDRFLSKSKYHCLMHFYLCRMHTNLTFSNLPNKHNAYRYPLFFSQSVHSYLREYLCTLVVFLVKLGLILDIMKNGNYIYVYM